MISRIDMNETFRLVILWIQEIHIIVRPLHYMRHLESKIKNIFCNFPMS